MAFGFDGVNDYLESIGNLDLTAHNKLAIAFFFWWDAFTNGEQTVLVLDGTNYILIRPNWSAGSFLVGHNGNVGASLESFARPSAGVWNHFAMNIDITKTTREVDSVYINGTAQTLTNQGDANNTGTFSSALLRLMYNGGTIFGAGRIAELGFWGGINMTQTQAQSLSNGALPSTVQPGSLLPYWRLCGIMSPEEPASGFGTLKLQAFGGAAPLAHPASVNPPCPVPVIENRTAGFFGSVYR